MYAVIASPRIAIIASDAVRHDPLSLHEWKQKLCGKYAATLQAPCLPQALSLVHVKHATVCPLQGSHLFVCVWYQVAQFASYGRLFKSSEPVQLTEEETEYNIVAIKHVFPSHTVLQFQCTNTVQEQVLEDVSVSVDLTDAVSPSGHNCMTQLALVLAAQSRAFLSLSISWCVVLS